MASTSLATLSLHQAVCLHRAEGEVYQAWEDAKVQVGPVWKVCKERLTRTCFGWKHHYSLIPLSLNLINLTLIFLFFLL
jgi:hypothetical protein